ncbi:hypothetical protein WBG78_10240 [Chryseolinea sp. T2]|uniref:hypothetical protein n=1 Tax=Chryseolinea sp. T2 TaxID=3129255 RepID=UPI0030780B3B
MRYTFVLFLFGIVSLCHVARAQNAIPESDSFMNLVASNEVHQLTESKRALAEPSGYFSMQREMYKIPQEPGQRMMKVGKILTCVGTATVITGLLVYNNRDPNYSTQGTYGTTYNDDPHESGGQLLVAAGVGMIVPGVMVWIHGSNKFRKHVEKSTQAVYIPAGKLGLGYRF